MAEGGKESQAGVGLGEYLFRTVSIPVHGRERRAGAGKEMEAFKVGAIGAGLNGG